MKKIWHSRETELSSKKAADLVFKTHQGTYFVDTTTPPLKANDYYEEISVWCYVEDLVKQTNLLQKKLGIATKALQYYAEGTFGSSVAQHALKDMEEEG